jgi:hypothetical protein
MRRRRCATGWSSLFGVCLASGCGHEVFEHQRPASDASLPDAGVPDAGEVDCTNAAEDTPCDDHDACTPSSRCRAGTCQGQRSFDDCTLASSEDDFGHSQGEKGWFYGSWNAGMDADGSYDSAHEFALMEYCGAETWQPQGRCSVPKDSPAYRWTMNLAWGLQHPETRPGIELPVRRWVSDVSGPVRVAIAHKVGGTGSDGTRALLLVDGVEIWRHVALGGSEAAIEDELELELHVGSVIEQLVHPIQSSADDMTYFSLTIRGR